MIQATIVLQNGLRLVSRKPGPELWQYPSGRVKKGLIISINSHELVEEGVGLYVDEPRTHANLVVCGGIVIPSGAILVLVSLFG